MSRSLWPAASAAAFTRLYRTLVMRRPRNRAKLPAGFEIAMPLSLRMTITFFVAAAQLLSASKECPLTIDPSPMTATTCSSVPLRSRAAAYPSATESALPAWPATAASACDSAGFGNGEMPYRRRRVPNASLRPVRIFQA